MNTFNDIKPTSKITSSGGLESSVDLITDNGVYISFRGQPLKGFDRLYFSKDKVNEMFESGVRKLIDGRIITTLEEIRNQCKGVFIEGIDEEIDIENIFDKKYKGGTVFCKNTNGLIRKILKTEEVDGIKYVYLTPMLSYPISPSQLRITIKYIFDEIKDDISLTGTNKKTLDEIASKYFYVPDASFLNITDLNNAS